ncbi:glutathione S-transferase family protein [Sphingopyxis sp. JAI128]|uniref:glutathione S-transferase family protein n=1 Tax=Sphingopyxis sp. JAI128 TaxID=2723066 RepID=UPI00161DFA83|nr:glutathione S-transferase family protein [Sphingopyxis sp. JAI128]MBB6426943.1 glutathione S-transferase [Sphingopyxis sp. JAI128]
MQLYWIKAQAPRRVLALVKHLGIRVHLIELDLVRGDLAAAAFAAINPNRKVPVLIDGEKTVWESNAIMAHLCIRSGSDMWPATAPSEQVEMLRWLSWGDSHWSPALAPFYFEHVVKPTFGLGAPDEAVLTDRTNGVHGVAAVLDLHLAGRTHVACGRLTIADFALASMATYWRDARMPLGDYGNITEWLDHLLEYPAWADPWPRADVDGFIMAGASGAMRGPNGVAPEQQQESGMR